MDYSCRVKFLFRAQCPELLVYRQWAMVNSILPCNTKVLGQTPRSAPTLSNGEGFFSPTKNKKSSSSPQTGTGGYSRGSTLIDLKLTLSPPQRKKAPERPSLLSFTGLPPSPARLRSLQ